MKKYLALFMGMIMSATIAQAAQAAPNNIPTITIGWANELHTGNAQLTKMIPEVFADNPVHLKPISSSQFELIKDGEVIACQSRPDQGCRRERNVDEPGTYADGILLKHCTHNCL